MKTELGSMIRYVEEWEVIIIKMRLKRSGNYEIDMIHGSIMPKLVTFFIPLMLSGVLQLLFNAVDLVVVGKWAGSNALAAVGATTALIHMFSNLMMGVSMGTNVIVARYIALEDEDGTSEAVHTSVAIALILGFIVLSVGLLFSRGCLVLMGTPANVIDSSAIYMKIYFCGMPFFAVYNYGAAILRASGDTKRPLYYLVIAGVLNAGLNMILVIIFHLDVVGVALATIFSQMVSCVLMIRCLLKTKAIYQLHFCRLHINWQIMKKIFVVGIPTGLQSTVINFSNVLLQSSVNSFGPVAMAGYTAANNILGFLYVSVNSITQACMSFTSQNYAVRNIGRIKRVIADCLILECIVSAVLGVSVHCLEQQLLGFYTGSGQVIACGVQIFTYTTITYFLCAIMDCLPGAMRGLGNSAAPMILAILGTVGTRAVWVFLLFPHYRSLDFLFISYPVSWLLSAIMQTVCLFFVFRKSKKSIS